MWKVPREWIDVKNFGNEYFSVSPWHDTYIIQRDSDGYVMAMGKEIKGYIGDIIYLQYDGVKHATGNYYLMSDRHGMICKWKEV